MKYSFIIINLFFCVVLFAQKPEDDINFKKFDASFLETLLENKINNYRKEHHRHLLQSDDYLKLAAEDQSKYILKTNREAHHQPAKKKATPFDRVVFYDGTHKTVAENCSKVVVGGKIKMPGSKKRVNFKSYERVVEHIFYTWKKAKGGAEMMLDPLYYRLGTSAKINAKEKVVVITQVYASEPFKLPKNVKYVKDNYKISPFNKGECTELEKKYAYLPALMSDNIFFKDNQIYFYFHDLALFKDVLKESDDAIAIDIVSRDQFSCGKGNIYYPSDIHKGVMLPPISKSHLFSKNELKEEGQLEVSLGAIPDYVDTNNVEINLLIIKDNCLCQTIVYNSMGGENIPAIGLEFQMDTSLLTPTLDTLVKQDLQLLLKKMKQAIEEKDYVSVKSYQSALFSDIRNEKMDKDAVLAVRIPYLKETASLNNNKIGFKWYYATKTTNKDSLHKQLLVEIEEQLKRDPSNSYLRYNKQLLTLLLWTNNYSRITEPKDVLKEIKLLYASGMDKKKTNQLLLNFHIISADFYYENKKFKEREKALKNVRNVLYQLQLTRDNTHKMASYFMFQLQIDWSIELMKPWVEKEDVDEDFLFTFLSVAIYNNQLVSEKRYIEFMEQAKKMNKQRFCSLFGFPNMSFQLLKHLSVKEMYCKTCN